MTILGRLYVDKREEQSRALVISPLASRRLLRTADRIERDFREHFLPQFLDESRLLNVVDFEKLATADLVAEIKRLHDRFVFDTHVAVDVVNIAAGFYLDRARKVLGRRRSIRRACSAISRKRTRLMRSPRPTRRPPRAGAGCCSRTSVTAPCSTMNWPSRATPRISTRSTA